MLSVTTFWSFLREFSPLEVCGDENNRAPLSGELLIGLHVPLHLSIGQAHAGDGRISSECELWKSFLHHPVCGSRLHRGNSTEISSNLRFPHGNMARTRAKSPECGDTQHGEIFKASSTSGHVRWYWVAASLPKAGWNLQTRNLDQPVLPQ